MTATPKPPPSAGDDEATARAAVVAAYYDEYTSDYLECTDIIQYGRFSSDDQQHLRILTERAGIQDGQRILDCGCGVGAVMRYVAELFPHVVVDGVTLSPEQVHIANERFLARGLDRCTVRLENFECLSAGDDTYDVLLFCETLGYADPEASLREAFRVTRPGGTVYVKEILTAERQLSGDEQEELEQFNRSWLYDTRTPSRLRALSARCGFDLLWMDPSYSTSHEIAMLYRRTRLVQRHPLIREFPPITFGDLLLRKPVAT